MRVDYALVLCKYFPDCQFTCLDSVYETLKWDDTNTRDKPTKQELETLCEQFRSELPYDKLRNIRNSMLKDTDYIFTTDFPISDENKVNWVNYRQALRDLPENSTPSLDDMGNLVGVEFPEKPNYT